MLILSLVAFLQGLYEHDACTTIDVDC